MKGTLAAIAIALFTRAIIIAAAYQGAAHTAPGGYRDAELSGLSPLLQWDADHYRAIVENGYSLTPADDVDARSWAAPTENNLVYFPLYPAVCRALAPLLGARLAMVVVSNGCALLAAALLYHWARRRTDERAALCCVALAFCWPSSSFWSFGYAESTTLACMIAALFALDTGHTTGGGLLAALATAARPTAICLAPIFALAAHFQRAGTWAARARRGVAAGLLAAGGAILWLGYVTIATGSVFTYPRTLHAAWIRVDPRMHWMSYLLLGRVWDQFKYFGRALRDFPTQVELLIAPLTWQMPLALLLILASVLAMRRARGAWRVILLLAPLIFALRYAQSGWTNFGVESMGRYVGLAAPAFIVLAQPLARRGSLFRGLLLGALLGLQAISAAYFGAGAWTG